MVSFDQIPHQVIMAALAEEVADGNILRLVEKFLTAGVMENGVFKPATVGTPQGGVVTPQTMLRTGPASGALDKREVPYLVNNSDFFLANLHAFYKGTNDLPLVAPVQLLDAVGKLLCKLIDMTDYRPERLLLVHSRHEFGLLLLKVG